MSDDFDFSSAMPDAFKIINHNKTDHARFRREQERVNENFKARQAERVLEDRKANLKVWDAKTPPRWAGASLTRIVEPAQSKLKKISAARDKSTFILGPEGSGKTYAAYALIRRLVGRGHVLPSRIRTYTESDIVEYSRAGFAGRDTLQSIVDDKKVDAIILDGVGFVDDYSDAAAIAIERVIEKAYSDSLILIVTGVISPKEWIARLSESAEVRLRAMIQSNVVELPERDTGAPF